jgi:hypothetical protein
VWAWLAAAALAQYLACLTCPICMQHVASAFKLMGHREQDILSALGRADREACRKVGAAGWGGACSATPPCTAAMGTPWLMHPGSRQLMNVASF